jgi:prepilin-type N-terminal cleavage/methylation domain-containing protein
MNTLLRPVRAGFTLLEVMVSTAIMVIIVLTVVSIASDTLRVYDQAVADLSTQSEARGALDALENDFSTAMLRADGRCWMEVVVPGSSSTDVPGPPVPGVIGNLQASDHPILMLFGAPTDRPRWTPGIGRTALRGDVCAISYRIGQRSPFDSPGEKIQQVYGIYRTLIDSENTFTAALPLILSSTMDVPKSPWNYWSGSQRFINYSKVPTPDYETRALIDANIESPNPCWTMDENNFIASNVVAMNLVFWGTSSLPATAALGSLKDPCARLPRTLRPVVLVGKSDDKSAMAASKGGYLAIYKFADGATDIATAPLRYAPNGTPTIPAPTPNGAGLKVQPYDYFSSRLRIHSDRMYPDTLPLKPTSPSWLPYLPYSLKAIEVSLTILTPEGSKELRGLQMLNNNQKVPDAEFKRIVYQHGRNYTRYIRVLSNGG